MIEAPAGQRGEAPVHAFDPFMGQVALLGHPSISHPKSGLG
jgi:hypothetical protein